MMRKRGNLGTDLVYLSVSNKSDGSSGSSGGSGSMIKGAKRLVVWCLLLTLVNFCWLWNGSQGSRHSAGEALPQQIQPSRVQIRGLVMKSKYWANTSPMYNGAVTLTRYNYLKCLFRIWLKLAWSQSVCVVKIIFLLWICLTCPKSSLVLCWNIAAV